MQDVPFLHHMRFGRTTGLRIRIRIMIFSSMAFKPAKKVSAFYIHFAYYSSTAGTFTPVFKDSSYLEVTQYCRNKDFLDFFACWWKDPDPEVPKLRDLEVSGTLLSWRCNLSKGMEGHLYLICRMFPHERNRIETAPFVIFPYSQARGLILEEAMGARYREGTKWEPNVEQSRPLSMKPQF